MAAIQPILVTESDDFIFKLFDKKGVVFAGMPNTSDEEMKNILNFDTFVGRQDDVWVCGYAKSGTHWEWEIVSMLIRKSTVLAKESKEVGFLEMQGVRGMEVLESPRVLNTHSPLETMPADVFTKRNKIIVIMRNPKDIEVSFWHMGPQMFTRETTFKEFVEMKFASKVFNGGWFHNVLGWYDVHKDNPDVLFIKYEDIQRDHIGHIKKIASHLNIPHDEELFQRILEKTSFQHMKENKNDPHSIMYRKGKVGDWKNHFTVAMNEAYDADFNEKMKDTDLTFDFEI